jgi:hypothetical protein
MGVLPASTITGSLGIHIPLALTSSLIFILLFVINQFLEMRFKKIYLDALFYCRDSKDMTVNIH